MSRWIIKDRPGVIPVATIREWFESGMGSTPTLTIESLAVERCKGGEFNGYIDPNTDAMWIGFAIGVRCSERLYKAGRFPAPYTTDDMKGGDV